jgi:transcriptional regulator with XRE-family HTH domain
MDYGTKLRVMRAVRGMSQLELGYKSGVANVTLSQIETGKFLPTPELDRAIRDGLCWTEREDTALEMLNGERVPA